MSEIDCQNNILICFSYEDFNEELLLSYANLFNTKNSKIQILFIEKIVKNHKNNIQFELNIQKKAIDLGFEVHHISSSNYYHDLLNYAKLKNITDIVLNYPNYVFWNKWFVITKLNRFLKNAGEIQIHLKNMKSKSESLFSQYLSLIDLSDIQKRSMKSFLIIFLFCFLISPFLEIIRITDASMILILLLMLCSYLYGFLPSLVATLIALGSYYYMFLSPQLSFSLASIEQVISFFVFMAVSFIIIRLTSFTKYAIQILQKKENTLIKLYNFSKYLNQTDFESQSDLIQLPLDLYFDYETFFIESSDHIHLKEDSLKKIDSQLITPIQYAFSNQVDCGFSTQNNIFSINYFLMPISIENRKIGIVGVKLNNLSEKNNFMKYDKKLFLNMCSQINIVLRKKISDEDTLILKQKSMQNLILSSLSHDLKTPLSSIIGSLSSLETLYDSLDKNDRLEFIQIAQEEAKRLEFQTTNMLNMLKLENKTSSLKLEKINAQLYLKKINTIFKKRYPEFHLEITLQDNFNIKIDTSFFDQAIFNLLDNAVKYSHNSQRIQIKIWSYHHHNLISISNKGNPIEKHELTKIFDYFYQVRKSDLQRAGSGLGLAIVKEIISAHDGKVSANSMSGMNTFTIQLRAENNEKNTVD